jgi:ABC-type xylose transport system permease subunit
MKIAKISFIGLYILAILWNLLCLIGPISVEKWAFSCTLVVISNLVVLFLQSRAKKTPTNAADEPVKKQSEKTVSVLVVILCVVWFITSLACILYPL